MHGRQRKSSLAAAVVSGAGVVVMTLALSSGVAAAASDNSNASTNTNASSNANANSSSNANTTASSNSNASDTATSHSSSGTAGTSGTTDQPQPQSTADTNSGGANGQCPGGTYCSTRDGSASGNGNGNGQATGKPCAGCVGKADNKNPPGQEKSNPRTTFPNNGYECDNNSGIGRTNPAHTGCRQTTTTPNCTTSPPPAGCTHTPPSTPPTPNCATQPNMAGCTSVLGEKVVAPTAVVPPAVVAAEHVAKPPTTVRGLRAVRTTTPSLPMTGSNDSLQLLGLGAALTGAGTALLVIASRRRRHLV